jgi:hypothetical protein
VTKYGDHMQTHLVDAIRGWTLRTCARSFRPRRFTALAIVSKKYERRLAGNPLVAGPLAVVDPSSVRGPGGEGAGDDCCSD